MVTWFSFQDKRYSPSLLLYTLDIIIYNAQNFHDLFIFAEFFLTNSLNLEVIVGCFKKKKKKILVCCHYPKGFIGKLKVHKSGKVK